MQTKIRVLFWICAALITTVLGCNHPVNPALTTEDLIQPDGPVSAEELLAITHDLAPGETARIHVDDLDGSAREAFAHVVDGALQRDGIILLESGPAGPHSRGSRVCRWSIMRTGHKYGCTARVKRYAKPARVYGRCPHTGYVSTNRGMSVEYRCTKRTCPYRQVRLYEYHERGRA